MADSQVLQQFHNEDAMLWEISTLRAAVYVAITMFQEMNVPPEIAERVNQWVRLPVVQRAVADITGQPIKS